MILCNARGEMKIDTNSDLDWKQSIKIGLADAIIWIWFLQTAYASLFTNQLSSILYFLPENSCYSIVACLVVSLFLVSTKWDSIPRLYRVVCSICCVFSIVALLLVQQFSLYETGFEFLAFFVFVIFYYGSQVLRIETLAKCKSFRTLLVAVIISFLSYYLISVALLSVPLPIYNAFIIAAPLVLLVEVKRHTEPATPVNTEPWKSLVNLPIFLLFLFGTAGGLLSAVGSSNPAIVIGGIFDHPSPVYLIMVLSYMVVGIVTVYRYRLHKGVYFAIMSIIWMLGSFLGTAIISFFPSVPDLAFVIIAALMGIIIVISFIANQNAWIKGSRISKDRAKAIETIAHDKGLTKRETEVLHLLMEGRSIPYIQNKLYISEGTARTHAKHIYTKVGVHSKQELLDLLSEPE